MIDIILKVDMYHVSNKLSLKKVSEYTLKWSKVNVQFTTLPETTSYFGR